MARTKVFQMVGAPTNNQTRYYNATWDFSTDGGATGALDLFEADGACLITEYHLYVESEVTTSATGTVSVGVTGSTSKFSSSVAAATLAANYTVREDAIGDLPHYLADGEKVIQTINTGALTAGKIHYRIGVQKPKT